MYRWRLAGCRGAVPAAPLPIYKSSPDGIVQDVLHYSFELRVVAYQMIEAHPRPNGPMPFQDLVDLVSSERFPGMQNRRKRMPGEHLHCHMHVVRQRTRLAGGSACHRSIAALWRRWPRSHPVSAGILHGLCAGTVQSWRRTTRRASFARRCSALAPAVRRWRRWRAVPPETLATLSWANCPPSETSRSNRPIRFPSAASVRGRGSEPRRIAGGTPPIQPAGRQRYVGRPLCRKVSTAGRKCL